ncbi:MAG: helix-hairpin-helix domain-containing protein [Polyangiaceae bacterium]|jgi:competence protein ComEA|nr:helix-hairpin-helix domain-containing protein [Polyangiaceae bacterium]MBK8942100.1 helix-hairpin-helix domain-containing protein [Polyangiaceae bacterium]
MNRLRSLVSALLTSAWGPAALRGVAFSAALVGLGLLGSGLFDRWLVPRSAAAAPGGRARPPHATSAVAPRTSGPHARAAPSAPSPSPSSPPSSSSPAEGGKPSAKTPDGRLVLNLATLEEIDALPGIGPSKARAIVDLRAKLGGRFKKLEELMRVRGIKRKLLERIRPLVVLDPPPA